MLDDYFIRHVASFTAPFSISHYEDYCRLWAQGRIKKVKAARVSASALSPRRGRPHAQAHAQCFTDACTLRHFSSRRAADITRIPKMSAIIIGHHLNIIGWRALISPRSCRGDDFAAADMKVICAIADADANFTP